LGTPIPIAMRSMDNSTGVKPEENLKDGEKKGKKKKICIHGTPGVVQKEENGGHCSPSDCSGGGFVTRARDSQKEYAWLERGGRRRGEVGRKSVAWKPFIRVTLYFKGKLTAQTEVMGL